jgi:hypothetical protein
MARPKAPPKEKKPIVTTKAPPEVEALAKELIEADHPSLKDAGIVYGFFGEGKKMKRFGKAEVIREHVRTLLSRPGTQFNILISPDRWRSYNDHQRRQHMDELLCSLSYDGKVARVEKPDCSLFRANVLHYGVEGHEKLEATFRNIQLTLPELLAGEVESVPANVDPETGEIMDAGTTGDGEAPSVTLSMGGTTAVLTPETRKNVDKLLKGEQKPRIKGADGFGAVPEKPKRGATAAGPQVPAGG